MDTNNEKSIDVYSLVTNRIIELLEEGTVPWQQPWNETGIPRNLISKRHYRGINFLLLNSLSFTQNLFLTWKQVKTVGGSVLKGEKGHFVVFTKMVEVEKKAPEEKTTYKPFLRYYKLFNVEQCKDLPKEFMPKENEDFQPLIQCDTIVENMPNKPKIVLKENQAYYQPLGDFINMPKIKTFKTIEDYYSVLFHELVHSTGHESRLNRKEVSGKIIYGSNDYSLEELTAEIGACFLKGRSGIPIEDLSDSASYIQNWLEVLKNDKRFVLQASSRAQRAVEFIMNEKVEYQQDGTLEENPVDTEMLEPA